MLDTLAKKQRIEVNLCYIYLFMHIYNLHTSKICRAYNKY